MRLPNTAHQIVHELKLPNAAHTSRPWRIHEIPADFRLEDLSALPTPGGPDDFPRLVRRFAASATSDTRSWPARMLFGIRWKLGELFCWDDGAGGYRGQMAVLVKSNGLFGKVCFAAIAPFRYLIVYPPLMRGISQEWQAGMLWAGVSPKASMPEEA